MNPAHQMQCEYPGCNSNNTKDYHRVGKERYPGWATEPIALCPEHAGNREPILVNPYANVPKPDENQSN